ncbi:hypothetical protein ACSV5M_02080 [Cellvibrio sp. ARAG 10.3]
MTDKPLTNKEKQFAVLPNETDPGNALVKANNAVVKALAEINKHKRPK